MAALGAGLVEMRAQFLERGDIDFLDIGEMRDMPPRFLQMLGDRAAQADDRHVLNPVAPGQRGSARGLLATARRGIGGKVFMGDAPARTGAGDELQLDAEIPGLLAHCRGGERLVTRQARGTRRWWRRISTLTRLTAPPFATLSRIAGEGLLRWRRFPISRLWERGNRRRSRQW